jgi:hypothetical protein
MAYMQVMLMDKNDGTLEFDVEGITYEPTGKIKHKEQTVTSKDYASLNELCKVHIYIYACVHTYVRAYEHHVA